MSRHFPDAIVYTETVVHTAPERFLAQAPYQIAIVELPGQGRLTVRIVAEAGSPAVCIGEHVSFVSAPDGIPFYRRSTAPSDGPAYESSTESQIAATYDDL